jgi:hypothetical protein
MSNPSASVVEGRAIVARPSTRLLFTLAALAASAFLASAAQAEKPDPLTLTESDPVSSVAQPAQSLTPRLIGRGDGGITTVFGGGSQAGSPGTSVIDDNNLVRIYANASCTGTPDWTGTVNEIEGAGIEVEATPDSDTTYTAIRVDPEDEAASACSNTFIYWHSTTPVTPPPGGEGPGGETPGGGTTAPGGGSAPQVPRLRTVPAGRANDNTPTITGSAPGAATVKVFATPNCDGSVAVKGSAAEFAAGLQAHIADDTTTSFSAVSVGGGESACSAPIAYVEDSSAPSTRITMGPGVKTRRRKAVFRFADISGDPPGTTFLCKVDRKKWAQCHSPFKLKRLGFRRHVLRVRAIDLAGNAETRGAKRSFKVVRAP